MPLPSVAGRQQGDMDGWQERLLGQIAVQEWFCCL
jgi:hypothetical protein